MRTQTFRLKALLTTSVASLIALFSAVSQAGAGDRPFRTANAARSKSSGLGQLLVKHVERLPGPGREKVSASVIARFGRGAARPIQVATVDTLITRGDGWSVEVRGTGEWIRFRDEAYVGEQQGQAVPLSQHVAGDALEQRGRQVVQSILAPFVPLGPDEELQGWSVYRLMNSTTDASGVIEEEVVASRILFTRVIGGVPVIGPGGKVSVIFANDGTLLGFDVDWPAIKISGSAAKTAGLATIEARSDALLGLSPGAKRPTASTFECGYYDPGTAGADATRTLNPGCVLIVDPSAGSRTQLVVPIDAK